MISEMLLIYQFIIYALHQKFILKALDMHSNSTIAFHTQKKKIGNISYTPLALVEVAM